MCNPRLTAACMLQEIISAKIFLSEAKGRLESAGEQDNAFVNMLLLTALRHLVYIRKIIKQYVRKKLPAQSAFAQYALILGITEALYLDTPDYALINSYVDIVKKQLDKYVAGFVNAVLRKVCSARNELQAADCGEFFPQEFYKILRSGYGNKTIRKIENAALQEPCLDLTAAKNPRRLADELNGTLLPCETIRLPNSGQINKLPGYEDGLWWVQDFSAALAAKTLGSLAGKRVLDLCAAPGGKTAQLIAAGADVTALDVSAARLETLKSNLLRLKMSARIICADAVSYLKDFKDAPYDAVLLDAPCSATGTIRRHPELVHIKTAADVDKQVALQKQILNVVGNAVKPGGKVVCCVCSLVPAEGERQMEDFLTAHPEFRTVRLNKFVPREISEILTPEGWLRILPHHLSAWRGADGFFIAQLEKAVN